MKRSFLIFCLSAACLLCAGPRPSRAAVLGAPETAAEPPAATGTDTVFRFAVSAPEAAAYEAYRQENYTRISRTYTDEQIAASEESWLLYPVTVLCEAAAGPAGIFAPVCAFTPERSGTAEVSLTEEILPALAAAGLYTEAAFSFALTFSVAVIMNGAYRPLSERGEAYAFNCPATVRIEYVLPAGTDNSGNPAFLFAPAAQPLTLQNPTLRGHVFTGWQTESGIYVDSVLPAAHTRLYARFSPCDYRVNYVLTTRPGYSFQRVANTANPKTHTYGVAAPLYDVKAPAGYTFGGWYRDRDFSGEAVTEIGPDETGDLVFYARWLTEADAEEEAALAAGWGDLDADGAVTAADARLALRAAVELETLPPAVLARADFARLGRLNASNARILLRVAVGLDRISEILKQHGLL